MRRLVEIRSYALKPGHGATFDDAFATRALPLLRDAGIDVVAFGASPHDANARYLIRAFDDRAHLDAQESAFYGSDAWTQGPRETIVGALENYLDTLLWLSPRAIDDLRKNGIDLTPRMDVTRPA